MLASRSEDRAHNATMSSTALASVLSKDLVGHITGMNRLFGGMHGTRKQLEALYAGLGGTEVRFDLDHNLSFYTGKTEISAFLRCRRYEDGIMRLSMTVELTFKSNREVQPPDGTYLGCLHEASIKRVIRDDQSMEKQLVAFRQALVDVRHWYATLRLCDEDCTAEGPMPRRYCGRRAMPGVSKCASCTLVRGLRRARDLGAAKRRRLA